MNRFALFTLAAIVAPLSVSAAAIVVEDGGPYDVTSDTLFTGIAISKADGAGTYVVDFYTPGDTIVAIADAAVTAATVNTSFTNLTMSWLDGVSLNTIVSSAGVDTLTTVFNTNFPLQQLVFNWTNSDVGAGFRFDVSVSEIPLPATILLMGSALAGLGIVGRRRRTAKAAAA